MTAYNTYHKQILEYLKNKKMECWHNLFHQESTFIRKLLGDPPYDSEKIKEKSILAQRAFKELENDGLVYDKTGDRWYSLTPDGENLLADDIKKKSKSSKKYKRTEVTRDIQDIINNPWQYIAEDFDTTKNEFGRKINFIKEPFKRKVIFRDVQHAYILWKIGLYKPSVILSGGVTEELLRLYLEYKKVKTKDNTFAEIIKLCEENKILMSAVHNLSSAIRHFRNFVHIAKEKDRKHSVSKPTATAALAAIFTIANDF